MRRYFMANGPLGGNMGSAPVPPQPPQVSFTTTAESRGGFNNFLKSIPPTTAMTPLPPMGSSPMPPMGGNPMGNIDIFNQPMGMMGMNQPPMNPMMQQPMQPPMMMADGGNVPPRRTEIMGQDHMLSYITPEEGGILKALGGAGRPGPMGIPSFFDAGEGMGGYGGGDSATDDNNDDDDDDAQDYSDGSGSQDTGNVEDSYSGDYTGGSDNNDNQESIVGNDPVADIDFNVVETTPTSDDEQQQNIQDAQTFIDTPIDTRPSTNIVNVGAGSNLQYNPQFTADNLEDRGLDPKGFMSADNYAQTTQGQAASQAEMNDAMAIDQATNQAPAGNLAANIVSTYNPQQYGLGLDLDDPLGLGFNTAGLIEGARAVQDMRDPEQFTQVAGLGNVPGADVAAITRSSFAPTIGGVEDDLIGAITQGRSDLYLPFTNNPGNLKQAREDLTTETIKGFNADGTPRTGPALFNTLEAGQKALDDQLGRYGDRGISTPTDFVNTYLGTDVRENPLENRQGYINAVQNAVGSKFDLSNPATRTNITNAITRQELGQRGVNALGNQVTAATGLGEAFNAPITSAPTVSSPDPMATDRSPGRMSAVFGPEIASTFGGLTPNEVMNISGITSPGQTGEIPGLIDNGFINRQLSSLVNKTLGRDEFVNPEDRTTDIFSPSASDFANFQSTRDQLAPEVASSMNRGRSGGGGQNIAPQNSIQNALNRATRGTRGIELGDFPQTIGPETSSGFSAIGSGRTGQTPTTDTVYDIDTRPENALGFRDTPFQFDPANYIEGLGMGEAGGKGISALTPAQKSQQVDSSPPPADYEENVGKPYSGLDVGKVEDFYNAPTTFDRLGLPPGMFSTVLNFAENKARDFVAADLISGNFDPIYDRDGKITGSRNPKTGQVQSGMDFNAPDTDDDNESNPLILRPISKAKKEEEEKKDDDGTPNVFGGGSADPVSSGPLVVDSPFTSNVGKYTPVGFDAGDLNALIARLTGISSPKSMAKGGVIGYQGGGQVMQALDNLLATG